MKYLLPVCALTLIAACSRNQDEAPSAMSESSASATPSTPPMAAPDSAASPAATVRMAPTQGHQAAGMLTLTSESGAVRITGSLQGLPPDAEFGFHIHENGDCSAPDASSAGGHFNPTQAPHGDPRGETRHAGDLMNARSDAQGMAQVDVTANAVTLGGGLPTDVTGKAVVMHAQPDDYQSQPSGNSGARISCGVIE